MQTALAEAQAVAQIINTVGVIGILVFLVVAFYRGDIISKPVLDKIMDRFWGELNAKLQNLEDKIDAQKRTGW
jgi:hypothetical protein